MQQMPGRVRIVDLERALGFKWQEGIAREKHCPFHPTLQALLNDIDELKANFADHRPSQLWRSESFSSRCNRIFEQHGPQIWVSPPVDRSSWLSDVATNKNDGFYKEDLYYDNKDRREKLRAIFTDLLLEKCKLYCSNQRQKQKTRHEGALCEGDDSAEGSVEAAVSEAMVRHRPAGKQIPQRHRKADRSRPSQHNANAERGRTESEDIPNKSSVDNDDLLKFENIVIGRGGGKDNECDGLTNLPQKSTNTETIASVLPQIHLSTQTCGFISVPGRMDGGKRLRSQSRDRRVTSPSKLQRNEGELRWSESTEEFLPALPQRTITQGGESFDTSSTHASDHDTFMSTTTVEKQQHGGVQSRRSPRSSAGSPMKDQDYNKMTWREYGESMEAQTVRVSNRKPYDESRRAVSGLVTSEKEKLMTWPASKSGLSTGSASTSQTSTESWSTGTFAEAFGSLERISPSPTPSLERTLPTRGMVHSTQDFMPSVGSNEYNYGNATTATHKRNTRKSCETDTDVCYVLNEPLVSKLLTAPASSNQFEVQQQYDPLDEPAQDEDRVKIGIGVKKEPTPETGKEKVEAPIIDLTDEMNPIYKIETGMSAKSRSMHLQTGRQSAARADVPEQHISRNIIGSKFSVPRTRDISPHNETADFDTRLAKGNIAHGAKILNIDLLASEHTRRKFVCVSAQTPIEDLFKKVQSRLQRRLEGKRVQALGLSLPGHPKDKASYIVDSDDPDTWRMFLSRVAEMDGNEIDVDGIVEL